MMKKKQKKVLYLDSNLNKVLIGSYGESSGISFNKHLALLTSHDLSDVEVYKILGKLSPNNWRIPSLHKKINSHYRCVKFQ